MQETQIIFSQNFYSKHLSTIGSIHFTAREIDVISCILSARRTSKIAYLLSINPRTVETHIRNIMSKSGTNTREGIIDFIEAFPDKIFLLRKYYALLLIEAAFEKSLKDIARLNREIIICFLRHERDMDSFVLHLKWHLNLAGITVSSTVQKIEKACVIFILSSVVSEKKASSFLRKYSTNKMLFLLQKNHQEIPKQFADFDIINFTKHENYYFSFFIILKKLLPHLHINKTEEEFKEKYKTINLGSALQQDTSPEKKLEKSFKSRIRSYLNATRLAVVGVCGALLVFSWNQSNDDGFFRSELILPEHSLTLNRPELINQIEKKLRKQNGIQTVALVGIGGAGKTTIARQYAWKQKIEYLWEINAETRESLKISFESLARKLANTEKHKKTLREIQEIKDSTEKEENIINFVRSRLKTKKKWLLIFDNVETFADIQKYFPYDSEIWGRGKVIITTRDSNIDNTCYIKTENVIKLRELDKLESLTLFCNILYNKKPLEMIESQTNQVKNFLKHIPFFPLDVSTAAYYLKDTHISFEEYLNRINQSSHAFDQHQESVLKEANNYNKTRYGVLTVSLKKIIEKNPVFKEFLLFICLLDSQNIPRNLLSCYQNKLLVDYFIHELKKHSLIISEQLTDNNEENITFSIHRTVQKIIFFYLIKELNLEKDINSLKVIKNALENYTKSAIDKEDFLKIRILVNHCTVFLQHRNLLINISPYTLVNLWGAGYYYLGNYLISKKILEENLANLNKNHPSNSREIGDALFYLGNVYRDMGDYEKAINVYYTAMNTYGNASQNKMMIADTLRHLGPVYRDLGNHGKARELLEQSLSIYKKYFSGENHKIAWILINLGNVYRNLGNCEKAKELIEKGLTIYNEHFPNHIGIGWSLTYLGNVQKDMGHYKKAKESLEKSLEIYKKHYSEEHIDVAWLLASLGNVHSDLGNHEKAKELLEKSLSIYKKYYSEEHIDVAWVLTSLKTVYKNLKS